MFKLTSNSKQPKKQRLYRTLNVLSTTILAAILLVSPVLPAYAHDGAADDATHAEQDLANTSISDVEKMTEANKARIKSLTGREPGKAYTRQMVGADQRITSQAADDDPGVSGSWSSVVNTEVIPIFQAVLPNGKVLMWDSVGDNASETYPVHNFTRAMVWNPANNTSKRVDVQGYNIFCAGFAHLSNGNILVAGGNKDAALAGIVQTHIFDWRTETWSRGRNMLAGRWYPSLSTMANGEVAIIGGGPRTGEVYQTNGIIRQLTAFNNAAYGGRIYPFMTSRPDTLLQLMGPYNTMYSLNTSGIGAVTGAMHRDGRNRQYGSFATYDIGKTLIVGGGDFSEYGAVHEPTRSVVTVNTNTGLNPTVTNMSWLAVGQARRQHNVTVIADGSVIVTGGMNSTAESGQVDLDSAMTAAARWNPATNTWTTLASAARVRQYHSTAALLPDGRVLTGGGGVCGECMTKGYLEKNLEYFTPPYLYRHDGSGQLADRPVISSAPATININSTFSVTSPQAGSIRKLALVGLADVTHSVDQGQRYIPLRYTVNGTTLTATAPGTGGIAPPGYYMLFAIDAAGVPSVARIVSVNKSPNPTMSPVRNRSANRCIDIPGSSLANKVYLQSYTCNNSRAQALSRLPNDNSIRILGKCITVPNSRFVSGQRLWMYACNGTSAQRFQFRSDGTIRPIAKQNLCVMATSRSNKATIKISTCSSSTLQRWTW